MVASIAPTPRFDARRLNTPAIASSVSAVSSTIVESALIEGETPNLSCAEDVERQRRRARARREVRDHHVVERDREREHRAGDDPGRRERQHDPEERLERRRAEIGGGFDQPVVERGEARLHDDDDERDAERDVRGDHGRRCSAAMCANRRKNAVSEMAITISGMTSEMKISVE